MSTVSIESIVKHLEKLGLTSYQAKTYVALVMLRRPATAPEISQTSGVPKSRIYDVLEELANVQVNLIYKIPTDDPRRFKYQARPPEQALDEYIDPVKEKAKQELTQLFNFQNEENTEPPRVFQMQATPQDFFKKDIILLLCSNEEISKQLRSLLTQQKKVIPVITDHTLNGNLIQAITPDDIVFFQLSPPPLILTVIKDPNLLVLFRNELMIRPMFMNDFHALAGLISTFLLGTGMFQYHKLKYPHYIIFTKEHLQVYLEEGQLELNLPIETVVSYTIKALSEWVTVLKISIKGQGDKHLGTLSFHVIGDKNRIQNIIENLCPGLEQHH